MNYVHKSEQHNLDDSVPSPLVLSRRVLESLAKSWVQQRQPPYEASNLLVKERWEEHQQRGEAGGPEEDEWPGLLLRQAAILLI